MSDDSEDIYGLPRDGGGDDDASAGSNDDLPPITTIWEVDKIIKTLINPNWSSIKPSNIPEWKCFWHKLCFRELMKPRPFITWLKLESRSHAAQRRFLHHMCNVIRLSWTINLLGSRHPLAPRPKKQHMFHNMWQVWLLVWKQLIQCWDGGSSKNERLSQQLLSICWCFCLAHV